MRVDSNPMGKLLEVLAASAFQVHPYGRPVIGSREDISRFDRESTRAFFDEKWSPSRCTTAIVGDVDPLVLIPMLESYFGRIPARPAERANSTPEPEQQSERRSTIDFPAQPLLAMGWRIPPAQDPDAPAVEIAVRLLGAARSSRLERRLIHDNPLCASVFVDHGWPGDRHSSLALVLAVPLQGALLADIEAAILEEVRDLAEHGPEPEELEGVLRVARVEHLRSLRSNPALAKGMTTAHASTGDWRSYFLHGSRLSNVTAADVQRVLREHYDESHRTIVELREEVEESAETTTEEDEG